MKIRSFILTSILTGASLIGFAQKGELSTAKSKYDEFAKLKGAASVDMIGKFNLKAAKAAIDKAVTHEKTINDPSTWTYKALIYSDLALLDTVPATAKPLISEATSALTKAKELDKDGANKANIEQVSITLGNIELNRGVKAYQKSKFEEAYEAFNSSLSYRPGDTTGTYYAALAALNAKNYKAGIEKYESLTKTNFSNNKQIYLDLSRMYSMEKDTVAAIRVASEGAKKFPNDAALATQEIELSLMAGKQKEIIEKITVQAQKEPKNKVLQFYLGLAYNATNNPTKAEEAYKKALELDANYIDANLNLGSLLLNRGIEVRNLAVKLPQNKQKEYDAQMLKARAEFDTALPYLQKAIELKPDSRTALENLKTYYVLIKNQAKVDELTQKISSLK